MKIALPLLLFREVTLRHWRLSVKNTVLLVTLLALGVAVFVSIRLANRAAVSSFGNFADTLTGQSDWTVQAPAGWLPETVLSELRQALGTAPVHIIAVVEATAIRPVADRTSSEFGRPAYTLLGLDLFALGNLARPQTVSHFAGTQSRTGSAQAASGDLESGSKRPAIWVSRGLTESEGRIIELVVDETVREFVVSGSIPVISDAPKPPDNLIVMDLPDLQTVLSRPGQLTRIEFLVEAGPRLAERRVELRSLLEKLGQEGRRWIVSSPGARRETAEGMTRAFRLNLTILSLIALIVGLYLIFQALDGAVVRRRAEIAILRSLGVEERTIQRVWLFESAVLGLAGGALGLLLGWLGAQGAVRAVGQTVNALYFSTTVKSASMSWGEALLAIGLGTVASLVAGFWPAYQAARTPPAQILQRSAPPAQGHGFFRNAAIAIGALGAGVVASQLPPVRWTDGARFPLAGYAAAFLWIMAAGLICGFLVPILARGLSGLGARSAIFRIPLSHLRQPSGRHRLACGALVCAIGMTAGMAILVASFEYTMEGWVARTLHADLYVASSGSQSASSRNFISAAAAEKIGQHVAVAHSSALLSLPIELPEGGTTLIGADLTARHTRPNTNWVEKPVDEAVYDTRTNQELALVTESFAERFGKRRGDRLTFPTPAGLKTVSVAGVYAEYGNERGSILVDRAHLQVWFHETAVTNLALFLKPEVDADRVRADLLAQYPGLSIYTNAKLRTEILRIFRQTFSITYALEVIGVIVAVAGLALTLASVLLDRRDELTTLRALGFARAEIAKCASVEGAVLSVCAALTGGALSLGLGWLLIYVINKQSFGWTLGFQIPWLQLVGLALSIVATGAAVSHFVGRWGADLPADREE